MSALENAIKAHPDQRVAQVIVNAIGFNEAFPDSGIRWDPFYVEDLDLERKLWAYAALGERSESGSESTENPDVH